MDGISTERMTLTLTNGMSVVIDAADFEREVYCEFRNGKVWTGRVCDKNWYAEKNYRTYYAYCKVPAGQLYLHRAVMCAGRLQLIDHRDGNGLNCWQSNLRTSNAQTNSQNRRPKGDKKFKGVRLHAQNNNYTAGIRINGKNIHLGVFATEEEAARAYDRAAFNAYGEFAYLNFPGAVQ